VYGDRILKGVRRRRCSLQNDALDAFILHRFGRCEIECEKLGDRGIVPREEVLPLVRRKFIQRLALGWKRRTIGLFIDFVEDV
jgi:hypothetical protein